MPKKAFQMYLNSAKQWPPSIKEYWHRWLFSALNVLGFGILSKYYYNLKKTRSPQIFREEDLENWYGIQFADTLPE
jgi:hypothetical protein